MDSLFAGGIEACYGIYHTGSGSGGQSAAPAVADDSDAKDVDAGACYGIYHTGSGNGNMSRMDMKQAGNRLDEDSSGFVLADWGRDVIIGSNGKYIAAWSDGLINGRSARSQEGGMDHLNDLATGSDQVDLATLAVATLGLSTTYGFAADGASADDLMRMADVFADARNQPTV